MKSLTAALAESILNRRVVSQSVSITSRVSKL